MSTDDVLIKTLSSSLFSLPFLSKIQNMFFNPAKYPNMVWYSIQVWYGGLHRVVIWYQGVSGLAGGWWSCMLNILRLCVGVAPASLTCCSFLLVESDFRQRGNNIPASFRPGERVPVWARWATGEIKRSPFPPQRVLLCQSWNLWATTWRISPQKRSESFEEFLFLQLVFIKPFNYTWKCLSCYSCDNDLNSVLRGTIRLQMYKLLLIKSFFNQLLHNYAIL